MKKSKPSKRFKKDYERIKRGIYGKEIDKLLLSVIENLVRDIPLEIKYNDHVLIGNWKGFRNCHIKPDLILVYRKQGEDTLELARLASHSELGF